MNDVRPLRELFSDLSELQAVLDDLNVKYVQIAANGHWAYEKLGRARHGGTAVEIGVLLRVADLVPLDRPLRSGEWALRRYDGVSGPSILIERLPTAVADRLPQQVLATLRRQVKQPGNGVIMGEPGSGKAGLLLWLALQIPDQPVLYIAENPPAEFPGKHIMHVFPPSSDAERRALERFIRLSAAVMWDRVVRPDDLQTLYGYPGAGRRWFTTDASSVRSGLRMLTAAAQNGADARFSSLLFLASSVIGRSEARNLLVREGERWTEEWVADDAEPALGLLGAYERTDIRQLGPTEVSVPGIAVADGQAAAAEAPAPLAEVSGHEPAMTVEVDVDPAEYDRGEGAVTGMLAGDAVRELQEQVLALEEVPAPLRVEAVAEATRAYLRTPQELLQQEATNPAAVAPQAFMDAADVADPTPTSRVPSSTMQVEIEDLEPLDDYDDQGFSGVFDGELDFESLAEEMLSEISEIETSLEDLDGLGAGNPDRLLVFDDPPPRRAAAFDPDESEEHTRAGGGEILRLAAQLAHESGEDSTRQFQGTPRSGVIRKTVRKDE